MSEANNKVPGHPLKIFDFVSGSGSYIIFATQIYHTALPYIISRERYIIDIHVILYRAFALIYLLKNKTEYTSKTTEQAKINIFPILFGTIIFTTEK